MRTSTSISIICVALLCLTVHVLVAQKYCQSGSKRVLTYYRWYGYQWGRWSTKYYCKYDRNPTILPTGTVRMASEQVNIGASRVTGRPEVWYRNQWGTFCGLSSYRFDWRDGSVICQQMGFGGRQWNTLTSRTSLVPNGSGAVWLDYLTCSETAQWITDCNHNGWGTSGSCRYHSNDAALYCRDRTRAILRDGPTPLEGRLYYFYGTSYRKVCDDYWDTLDSNVVCRQLGFGRASNYITSTTVGTIYGVDSSSSFWLDNVHCSGDEMFLHHCNANDWGSEDCSYYEEIAVNCTMPIPTLGLKVKSSSSIEATAEVDYYAQFSEGPRIKGFRFEYQMDGDDTWHYETPDYQLSQYTYTVNELKPYTNYNFKASLILVGAEQLRSFSTVQKARTWQGKPSAATGVWFEVLSSTQIRVYWNEVPEPNGVISRYAFLYWAKDPTWDHHNGRQYQNNPSATSYVLTGLNPYTTYAINHYVINGAGWSAGYRIVAQTKEDIPNAPPNDLTLTVHDHNSVTISWTAPAPINQRGVIINYQLTYYWQGITGGTIWPSVAGNKYTYTVNNIPPYSLFFARVRARTSVGYGPFTPYSSTRTDEAAPTAPPQGVKMLAVSATILEISWMKPLDASQNGIINKFTIQYGQSKDVLKTVVQNNDNLSFKILDADPHTIYYARVAASTRAGMGPYSDFVQDKTFEAPPEGPPRDVDMVALSSTSLNVTWLIPEEEDHNGFISGYLVELGDVDTGLVLKDINVAGIVRDHVFTGLMPYNHYFARVAAQTSAGQGPFSEREMLRLPADKPGQAPEIIQLIADPNEEKVTVVWTPLDPMFHNDAALTAYRVHYVAADPDAVYREDTVDTPTGTDVTLTLFPLDEGTAYTISVAAVNKEGVGPFSRGKPVVTSGQPPEDAPRNVRVWAVSSIKVHVQWDPPQPEGHQLVITDYIIYYREINTTTFIQIDLGAQSDTDRHEADIENLRPYTDYLIVVHATNDAGDSPGSIPHTIKTLSDTPDIAPQIINVIANATEARLTWMPISDDDARGVVIGYDVSYGINVQSLRTVAIGGHVYWHDFPGLEPYTSYVFLVAARNVNGTGPFSTLRSIKTLESISTPPLLLRAQALSPTSIQLTWNAPSKPNGDIRYILNYTSLHNDIVDTEVFTLPKFYFTYTVYNLQEHVEYEFIMLARNTAGDSEIVIAQEYTLEAPPAAAPDFLMVSATGPYSLNVTWYPPPIIHHNSPLTGYRITYKIEGGLEIDINTEDADVLTWELTNLIPYQPYTVVVAAINDAGIGPFSMNAVAYTDKTLPPAAPVRIITNSSETITCVWDTPMYPNGILQGYVLIIEAVYPPDVDDDIFVYTPSVLDTWFEISERHPGTNYTARLLVINDVGNSSTSFAWGLTDSELPTAAPSVWASPNGNSSTSLRVSWAPPNTTEWKGMIKEMILYYRESMENNTYPFKMTRMMQKELVYPEDMVGDMIVDGLKPYTLYEFKMVLVNDLGMGPESDMAYAVTYEDVPEQCQNFTLRVFNNNFNMTWNPPIVTNGVLRGYVFYLNQKQYVRLGLENFTLYIAKLEPKTTYNVELRAYTAAGEGAPVGIAALTGDVPVLVEGGGATETYLWYVVAACIAAVLIGVLLVVILAGTAYKRHRRVQALKAKSGFASDDWTLYDQYEDDAFVDHKQGFQVQENPYVGHEKDVKIKNVMRDIKGLKVGKEEVTEDDIANFDDAMDKLGQFDFDDDDTKPFSY